MVVSNILRTKQVPYNTISLINGILQNRLLIIKLLNNPLASWLSINFDFYLVLLTLEFLFVVFYLQLTQYVSIVFIQCIPQEFQDFLFLFSSFFLFLLSLSSLNTSFTEVNLSGLKYELIKASKIKTSIFNLVLNTILSSSFLFFLNDWLILFNSCCSHKNF